MKRITHKLKQTQSPALFHDSRADSRLFAKMITVCFDKINELQEEVEKLQKQINDPERNNIVEHYPPQPYFPPLENRPA